MNQKDLRDLKDFNLKTRASLERPNDGILPQCFEKLGIEESFAFCPQRGSARNMDAIPVETRYLLFLDIFGSWHEKA